MKAYFHSLEPVEELEGGRGRASGFIMRAMAENKLKHSGKYRKPTFPLAPGSKMNKPIEFDWRKLADKSQGGLQEPGQKVHWGNKGEYGASPFILHHFKGAPTDTRPDIKESESQRKARLLFTAKSLLAKATTPKEVAQVAEDLKNHFGNVAEKKEEAPPPELKVSEVETPKAKVAETPPPPVPKVEEEKPKKVFKAPKVLSLGGIDAKKYLAIYKHEEELKDDSKNPNSFESSKTLLYKGKGKWELLKSPEQISVKEVSAFEPEGFSTDYGSYRGSGTQYWATRQVQIKAEKRGGGSVECNSIICEGLHKAGNREYHTGKWVITGDEVVLFLQPMGGQSFKSPVETPRQRLVGLAGGTKGSIVSRKFHLRSLHEYIIGRFIGEYIADWETADAERKKEILKTIKKAEKLIQESNYLYTIKYDGEEYVSPEKDLSDFDDSDEEGEAFVWNAKNIHLLSTKGTEDVATWFSGDLSPEEKAYVLAVLNKEELPDLSEKERAKELKEEVKDILSDYKKQKRGGTKFPKSTEPIKYSKTLPLDEKNPEEIKVLPIRNKARYEKAKENLLNALKDYQITPVSSVGRAPLIGKETGTMAGKKSGKGVIARGVAFGFGMRRVQGYGSFSTNAQHPEVYKALKEFGNAIVPKGWDYQTIQLNHNVRAKKHLDTNNVGKSVIIGIGDYNGGDLRVFSPDSSKHQDYNIKDRPILFNGAVLPHETQAFSNPTEYERGKGRYTIVFFRHRYRPGKGNVGVGSGIEDPESYQNLGQPSKAEMEEMFF